MTLLERKILMSLMLEKDLKSFQSLADEVGVARPYISMLWHGKGKYPKLRERIAQYFNVDEDYIFETDEELITQ